MEIIEQLEAITVAIEKAGRDITDAYNDWLTVGFSCATAGEAGLSYFLRISSLYSGFDEKQARRKWRSLYKGAKTPTLAPLFSLCSRYGIKVFPDPVVSSSAHSSDTTPGRLLRAAGGRAGYSPPDPEGDPTTLLANYSSLCKMVVEISPTPTRLAAATSFLVACSSCLPTLRTIYGGRLEYCHCYLCVIAPAGSGKGAINSVRSVLNKIHKKKREEREALAQAHKREALATKDTLLPPPPPQLSHFIPADISKAALIKLVGDNDGAGIIWESEIDTLATATRSDHGQFSDFLRKNYHSEPISAYRKGEDVFREVNNPHVSIVLTGTPDQFRTFFRGVEDGLLSRFLLLTLPPSPEFEDPFSAPDHALDWSYLGDWCEALASLVPLGDIRTYLSYELQQEHIKHYKEMSKNYMTLVGSDSIALVRRLALTHIRLASVLTVLKKIELGTIDSTTLDISPEAWEATRSLCATSANIAAQLLQTLPQQTTEQRRVTLRRERLLQQLPPTFTLQNFPPDIPQSTRYRYLSFWQAEGVIRPTTPKGSFIKTINDIV